MSPAEAGGQRRLLRQGVKNQKLSESRASARSSSFDLALLQSRFQRDHQNDRRGEQKAFKPLHVLLTYTWNLILDSIKKNISLLHSACNIAVKKSKSAGFGRKLKP